MRNKSIYAVIVVIFVLTLSGCSSGKSEEILGVDNYIIREVVYGEKTWEVYRDDVNQINIVVLNGKERSRYKDTNVITEQKLMTLPMEITKDSEDITKRKEYASYTWVSNLRSSVKYMNYLNDEGYKEVIKITTPDFIDMYVEKEGSVRRVIISEEYISVYEDTEVRKDIINKYINMEVY